MDNTGQGFLTFGGDYRIHREYSKPCGHFFKRPIEYLSVLDLLFTGFDLSEFYLSNLEDQGRSPLNREHELLDLVFAGQTSLDIIQELLPKEIQVLEKTLALEFRYIPAKTGQGKFMTILTDITKERELAAMIAEEEERNTMIIKVATDRDGFLLFLREMEELFQSVHAVLSQDPDAMDLNELFRYYHTIKGGAASYGLKAVAQFSHEIENKLEEIRRDKLEMGVALLQDLVKETSALQQLLSETLKQLSGILSEDEWRQSERVYQVRESKFLNIEQLLIKNLPEQFIEEIHNSFESMRKQPIGRILQKYAVTAKDLAGELNKPIEVLLQGGEIEVSFDRLSPFFGSMIHLIRNAVDHGLEAPEKRLMLGKTETCQIQIEAEACNQSLKLRIMDDGSGIDIARVRQKALTKKLASESFLAQASETEIMNLIFEPGFSTRDDVSKLSGRGVGLDAVKIAVEALQGVIEIQSQPNLGTTFEITIPNVL
ncbi:MAG: hypothetical protein COB67_09210 [SAR324 cluster bacterium]|uniref:histidine kinase n=1 Tax=SAR324 cluster bacterium TaxID=2024889 RepID=A0A2A4T0N2_9DELT|nr:MAG: hypothetical protein COB67_09210 [SAR324 cluster bacterium]